MQWYTGNRTRECSGGKIYGYMWVARTSKVKWGGRFTASDTDIDIGRLHLYENVQKDEPFIFGSCTKLAPGPAFDKQTCMNPGVRATSQFSGV